MSKKHSEETEPLTTEYADVFARLAAEDSLEETPEGTTEEAVETDGEEVLVESIEEIVEISEESIEEVVEATDETIEEAASHEGGEAEEKVHAEAETEVATLPADTDEVEITASLAELKPAIEAILFVADEPIPFNQLCKILGDVNSADVYATIVELMGEYEARNSGLELREIAGGWRISTRPQHHEFIRKYLKSKPSARLSLPALETLAVIAYKQPVTVPEVLEIRGVSSSSAIKTLLEKRLIVTKGRKETVGRPMMYGTSKEFLIQFGLRDLNELPSIEDFEELAA